MVNIFDVAKYILRSVGGDISTMQLQKLCYYAQAWSLAWDGRALFEEDFLRWDNGPVCKELFNIHKGMFNINSCVISNDLLSNELSTEDYINIDQTIEKYGKHSGAELSELTHMEDPWKNTLPNDIIKKDIIRDYYYSLLPENEKDEYWMAIIKQKKDEQSIPASEVWRKIGLGD